MFSVLKLVSFGYVCVGFLRYSVQCFFCGISLGICVCIHCVWVDWTYKHLFFVYIVFFFNLVYMKFVSVCIVFCIFYCPMYHLCCMRVGFIFIYCFCLFCKFNHGVVYVCEQSPFFLCHQCGLSPNALCNILTMSQQFISFYNSSSLILHCKMLKTCQEVKTHLTQLPTKSKLCSQYAYRFCQLLQKGVLTYFLLLSMCNQSHTTPTILFISYSPAAITIKEKEVYQQYTKFLFKMRNNEQ